MCTDVTQTDWRADLSCTWHRMTPGCFLEYSSYLVGICLLHTLIKWMSTQMDIIFNSIRDLSISTLLNGTVTICLNTMLSETSLLQRNLEIRRSGWDMNMPSYQEHREVRWEQCISSAPPSGQWHHTDEVICMQSNKLPHVHLLPTVSTWRGLLLKVLPVIIVLFTPNNYAYSLLSLG